MFVDLIFGRSSRMRLIRATGWSFGDSVNDTSVMGLVASGQAQMTTVRMLFLPSRMQRLSITPRLFRQGLSVLYREQKGSNRKYLDLDQLLGKPQGIWLSLALSLGTDAGEQLPGEPVQAELDDARVPREALPAHGLLQCPLAGRPLLLPQRHVLPAISGPGSDSDGSPTSGRPFGREIPPLHPESNSARQAALFEPRDKSASDGGDSDCGGSEIGARIYEGVKAEPRKRFSTGRPGICE